MGYRSEGKLYLSNKIVVPDNVKQNLSEWENIIQTDDGTIYEFFDWKWYDSFEDVKLINDFVYTLSQEYDDEDYDFIVVGEDNAIIHQATYTKFGVSMIIETYN